jgi:hypothetical protein
LSDPVLRRDDSVGGSMWGAIAGLGVIALVVFLLVAGYSRNHDTIGNAPAANNSSTATHPMTPLGTTSPSSGTQHPLMPAPQKPGTQQ